MMAMEKRGVVDEHTPPEGPTGAKSGGCCGGGCHEQQTKQAADAQEDHLATRLSDAAASQSGKK